MTRLLFFTIIFAFYGCGLGGGASVSSSSSSSSSSTTLTSSSSSSSSSTTSTTSTPTPTVAYESETIVFKNTFLNDLEGWSTSYIGACNLALSTSVNQDLNGALFVTNRAHSYDGPFLNVTNKVQPNQLYVIRGYLKQPISTTNTYRLMAKIGTTTPEYRELNRINVVDTDWNNFRAFVSFTQADIDAGVQIYINSDSNTNDFYLDSFEIAKTNYDTSDNSVNILKIVGTEIVDKNSNPIKIKGVNIIAYSDEDGSTDDTSAKSFMNYSYYNYDKSDFKNIASMGFNAVRISLWYRYFEDESNPYVYKEEGFAWLNTIVSWAKEAGIYVMLDMHAPQGGGFQGPANITPFWNTVSYQNRFKSLWKEIARRYKNDATIVAYDIINEPCANTQSQYLTLLNDTISEIRLIDTHHIINVENGFSSDNEPFILTQNNILYDFHFYDPWDDFTDNSSAIYGQNGVNLTQMRTLFEEYSNYYASNNVPFNVSEFGQKYATFNAKNSIDWVSDLIDLINEKNGNYFYFSYKGNEFGIYDNKNSFYENSVVNTPLVELLKAKQ